MAPVQFTLKFYHLYNGGLDGNFRNAKLKPPIALISAHDDDEARALAIQLTDGRFNDPAISYAYKLEGPIETPPIISWTGKLFKQ